jgi:hypothetical protein
MRGQRKYREASLFRAAGVVAHNECFETPSEKRDFEGRLVSDHPVRSFQRWLRDIFLMSRLPLLWQGGECAVLHVNYL